MWIIKKINEKKRKYSSQYSRWRFNRIVFEWRFVLAKNSY